MVTNFYYVDGSSMEIADENLKILSENIKWKRSQFWRGIYEWKSVGGDVRKMKGCEQNIFLAGYVIYVKVLINNLIVKNAENY